MKFAASLFLLILGVSAVSVVEGNIRGTMDDGRNLKRVSGNRRGGRGGRGGKMMMLDGDGRGRGGKMMNGGACKDCKKAVTDEERKACKKTCRQDVVKPCREECANEEDKRACFMACANVEESP